MFRASDIAKLVNTFGQTVTFERSTGGTYDTTTGTITGATDTNPTVKVYFYNYKTEEVDGNAVLMGDRKVAVLPKDTNGDPFVPVENDIISGVGDKVSIKRVVPTYSGNQVIVYTCQVRE